MLEGEVIKRIKRKRPNIVFMWGNGRDYYEYMCSGLMKYKNVKVVNQQIMYTWKEKQELFFQKTANRNIGEFCYFKWLERELHLKKNTINYIFFSESYVDIIDWESIYALKKNIKYKIRTALYVNDPVNKRMNLAKNGIAYQKKKFDLIVTTDKRDALVYHLPFFPLFYSSPEKKEGRETVETDLFFVGANKGRKPLIRLVESEANKRGLRTKIIFKEGNSGISGHKDWVEYKDILELVKKSNCLLEVVQEGQTGVTLRTMEAVCYGKKLLTNNQSIVQYSFYNEKFIQVFHDVKDIDFDFVKKEEKVEYAYNDEYSPAVFVKRVVKILRKKYPEDCT